jgi:teichuronic acid biosynthesis glycosyltransferase TuaC
MQSIKRTGIAVGYELCDLMSTVQPKIAMKIARTLSERLLPRISECNLVITRHILEWVQSIAPQTPSILVPGLFDADSFKEDLAGAQRFRDRHGVAESDVLVCYNGSWWKSKGLAMLMSAFKRARTQSRTPMKLVITGRFTGSPIEDNVSELVKTMGLEADVILPGHLNMNDVVGVLSAADIVVSSSTDDPFNYAAFPTKVAEYAGMGRAILATEVGDVPLYFQDGVNAVLTDAHSVTSIADGLIRLAEHSAMRERLGIAAKQTAREHFDFQCCGQRIDHEVRTLLDNRKCA